MSCPPNHKNVISKKITYFIKINFTITHQSKDFFNINVKS